MGPSFGQSGIRVDDLGRMGYRAAYERQVAEHARVVAEREGGRGGAGVILLVEHDPVITVSRRPGVREHIVATAEALGEAGVEVEETDRGGDVTYHGPGQLVAYPIVDLNRLGLRLHDYMRALEGAVMETCARFGVVAGRDAEATGVWVEPGANPGLRGRLDRPAKVCAMGVRVRRWITMHGLALNVTTNLEHFGLIVPCGLVGRPVTSLSELLGEGCPSMEDVKAALAAALRRALSPVESAPPAVGPGTPPT